MKFKTVQIASMLLCIASFIVTRPLYGQRVFATSGTYAPVVNQIPFFTSIGTNDFIGSSGNLVYDPGTGNITMAAGNLNMTTGNIALSYGNLSIGGTSTFSGSASFTSTVSISDGMLGLGGTSLTNSSGSLLWGGSPVAFFPTADTGQTLYYNSSGVWVATTDFYNSSTGIGIGTTGTAGYKLSVEGKVRAREVDVNMDTWADFVFGKDYKLTDIDTLAMQIATQKHLPGIPSAAEVTAKGQNLGEMNKLLLQKVEELTLYLIQQQKEIDALKTAQTNNTSN